MYEGNATLGQEAAYSLYEHRRETVAVYRVLAKAVDFDTFVRASLYMRNRLNPQLFVLAFYLAVIHRHDTRNLRLPPVYELQPHLFYRTDLLQRANRLQLRAAENDDSNNNNNVLEYDQARYRRSDDDKLNYLTEDVGWNEYYFYFRCQHPWLLTADDIGSYRYERRGEEYLYRHRHLLARYNLERLANGLGPTESFDYDLEFGPGYQADMSYPNGLPFPARPANIKFSRYQRDDIANTVRYEERLIDAIDSGYANSRLYGRIDLNGAGGLNILGNMIEGNDDSVDRHYYGNVDASMRRVLGFNHNSYEERESHEHPSALEHLPTSLRDPAFYRLYGRIIRLYHRYKENRGPYKPRDLHFPDLEIASVEVGELRTYFDDFETTISHGLVVAAAAPSNNVSEEEGRIKVRQRRLNHEPFGVNVTIRAKKYSRVVVKTFLGPMHDEHGVEMDLATAAKHYYVEIDHYVGTVYKGQNRFYRGDFNNVVADSDSTESYYRKLELADDYLYNLSHEARISGFPARLLLPRGRASLGGRPMRLFVHVAPLLDDEPLYRDSRVFGAGLYDARPAGYPLDRPVLQEDFRAPNMRFVDVLVHHRE
uniref:Uncharacterized protein n=1 Tax=Trichogramma kaykai TaxID=54128 RepID=A0ABD2WJI0_9HYME